MLYIIWIFIPLKSMIFCKVIFETYVYALNKVNKIHKTSCSCRWHRYRTATELMKLIINHIVVSQTLSQTAIHNFPNKCGCH